MSTVAFTECGDSSIKEAMGFGFDGVLLNAGINDYKVDIFHPVSWNSTDTDGSIKEYVYEDEDDKKQDGYDICGAHTNSNGYYHYHAHSYCVIDPSLADDLVPCVDDDECWDDPPAYLTDQFPRTLTPLGLAKDGHIVWGPYDKDGNLFERCDVDVCNGLWLDGYYSYVATSFAPYLPGCFGPGSTITYA
jgi:hypothetical protein